MPSPATVAADVAGAPVAAALAALAAVRGGKAVHPRGAVHRARLRVEPGPATPAASDLLREPAEHDALVRFSRSIGVPAPLPDLLGASIRVLDAYGPGRHQDLLLISSVDAPVLRHVFVPVTDPYARPYSSALPYRAGTRRFLVGALPAGEGTLRLAVSRPLGRFAPVGTLEVGERLPDTLDALRFNPFNTGGGLEPYGVLNGMRALAYPLSQAAWGAARPGGRARQAAADAALRP